MYQALSITYEGLVASYNQKDWKSSREFFIEWLDFWKGKLPWYL